MKEIPKSAKERDKVQAEMDALALKILKDRGAVGVAITVLHSIKDKETMVIASSEARKPGIPLFVLGHICSDVSVRMGLESIRRGEMELPGFERN